MPSAPSFNEPCVRRKVRAQKGLMKNEVLLRRLLSFASSGNRSLWFTLKLRKAGDKQTTSVGNATVIKREGFFNISLHLPQVRSALTLSARTTTTTIQLNRPDGEQICRVAARPKWANTNAAPRRGCHGRIFIIRTLGKS